MNLCGLFIKEILHDPAATLVCVVLPAFILVVIVGRAYSNRKRERNRVQTILTHNDIWGEDIFRSLIDKRISLGMTKEMVKLAWGKPDRTENKELTRRGQKIRWIYGQPRKGANYVWFTNGEVTKIQQ